MSVNSRHASGNDVREVRAEPVALTLPADHRPLEVPRDTRRRRVELAKSVCRHRI